MLTPFFGWGARRDPTTFIGAFSVWSLLCGVSFIMPGDVFELVIQYAAMRRVYDDENVWGAAMLFVGMLLLFSISIRSVALRSAVAGLSAAFWTFAGSLLMAGAYQAGWFSIVGAFSIWGALSCLVAIEQWIHYPGD